MVPAGHAKSSCKPGQAGYITQALGGSFTVYIDGNLFRIAGEDADAIGKEVGEARRELPPNATEEDVRELAWEQMRTCYDPEIPINIVDLGLVYECEVTANEDGTRTVEVKMTLTAPGCGMGDVLVQDVRDKIEQHPDRARRGGRAGVRSALEPEHDVRGGAPADGHVLKESMA